LPLNWLLRFGVDPQLLTLEQGKKSLSLPMIRTLFDACDRDMTKVAGALSRVLIGSGNEEVYGSKYFTEQSKAVLQQILKNGHPDIALSDLATKGEKLVKDEKDLYRDGTQAPIALRLASDSHVFNGWPGSEPVSFGHVLQHKIPLIAEFDYTLEPEHSNTAV